MFMLIFSTRIYITITIYPVKSHQVGSGQSLYTAKLFIWIQFETPCQRKQRVCLVGRAHRTRLAQCRLTLLCGLRAIASELGIYPVRTQRVAIAGFPCHQKKNYLFGFNSLNFLQKYSALCSSSLLTTPYAWRNHSLNYDNKSMILRRKKLVQKQNNIQTAHIYIEIRHNKLVAGMCTCRITSIYYCDAMQLVTTILTSLLFQSYIHQTFQCGPLSSAPLVPCK